MFSFRQINYIGHTLQLGKMKMKCPKTKERVDYHTMGLRAKKMNGDRGLVLENKGK